MTGFSAPGASAGARGFGKTKRPLFYELLGLLGLGFTGLLLRDLF